MDKNPFMGDELDLPDQEYLTERIKQYKETAEAQKREFNKRHRRFARWLHRLADWIGR